MVKAVKPNQQELTLAVKKSAVEMGFDLVSVSSAGPVNEDGERYRQWREKGYAADLFYMVREHPRRWVPQDLLPEARSVITLAVNFFSGEKRVEQRKGFGRVARYAWGKDYHTVIKDRLEKWVKTLPGRVGHSIKTKILVDSSPLLERAFAGQSGTGFVGKNSVIISRKLGSFIFLSEVVTDLELVPDRADRPDLNSKDECGSCRECMVGCPTAALVSARQLDARKCISYWTIENRGGIPEEIRAKMGDWIFGCDICQDVCPYNGLSKKTEWEEFLPETGTGPYLSLLEVLSINTEEEFRKRFAGTPLLRAKRNGLVRNGCMVAANQRFEPAIPLLKNLALNDPDSMVRSHAAWAGEQMELSRV